MTTAMQTSVGMEANEFSMTTSDVPTTQAEQATFGIVDVVIVVTYMVLTFAVGIWASCGRTGNTVKNYFLAGKHMAWLPVGASLFASNIGSGHFIGLAGAGAAGGIAIGSFEWIAPYQIVQLGWMFLPIYTACKVYTMPEYLHRRFGGARLRVTLSVISLALYVLTKIAVDLYAGALFIQQAFNINMYLAIVSLLVVTAIYTILGGLKAVIYTDTMQTVVMLFGGILLMIMSFIRIGGYENLKVKYMEAIPSTTIEIIRSGNSTSCGIPRSDSFHIFRDPMTSDLPWPGMILGIYLLGSWYWCTDQVIVQRALAAKSPKHAKAGCIVAGALKIIPMYMIVMTGMISRVFFPDEVACATADECLRACGNKQGCSNIAYPKLVIEILPTGLRGVMVAAMLSALMSSLTSIFNSTSTIFTIDVWKRIRKMASEREMLIVGKLTVCVLVVISILWIPVILSSAGGQLFLYLQSIQSALGPPIFALYLFGIMWPRINEKGAFWGLISGFTGGVIRLILDFYFSGPACDEVETRPWIVHKVNYLHVAPIVFLVSCVVTISVSYATEPLPEKQLQGTTWFTIDETKTKNPEDQESPPSPTKRLEIYEEEDTNKVTEKLVEDENAEGGEKTGVEMKPLQEKAGIENKDDDLATGGEKETKNEKLSSEKGDNNLDLDSESQCNTTPENNKETGELFSGNFLLNALATTLAMAVTFLMGYYA